MRKILLSIICCFITVLVFGQQATWNKASTATATSWNYSFSFNDASKAGIWAPTASSNQTSTAGGTVAFLPAPPSGAVELRTGGSGRPTFTITGNTDTLQFRGSTATNQNVGKFGAYNIGSTTDITSVNFTVNFSNGDVEWVFAIGSETEAKNFINATSSFTAGTDRTNAFVALKWSGIGGSFQLINGYGTGNASLTTSNTKATNADAYVAGTPYHVEVLINNNLAKQYYTKKSVQYTIPTGKFHLWINDVQIESESTLDLPLSGAALGGATAQVINAFTLQSKNPTSTTATSDILTISGLNMQSVTGSVLPVSLTSFTGKMANNQVALNWQTASESNNSHFDILRSSDDNKTAVKIGEVKGKGNSSALINYSYADKQAVAGNNYYQLRQVDNDGTATLYPQTIVVKVGLNQSNLTISAGSNNLYSANYYSAESGNAIFTLSDTNGRVLNKSNSVLVEGNNSISLYNQVLAPGVYILNISIKGNQLAKKFVVQ